LGNRSVDVVARVEGRGMAGSEGGSGNESQDGGVGAGMLRQVTDSDEGAGSERLIDDYDGLLGKLGYKGNGEDRGSSRQWARIDRQRDREGETTEC